MPEEIPHSLIHLVPIGWLIQRHFLLLRFAEYKDKHHIELIEYVRFTIELKLQTYVRIALE